MISYMSYGLLGLSGIIVSRAGTSLLRSSSVPRYGASSMLFDGRKESSLLISSMHSSSVGDLNWATPLFVLWVVAPPRASAVTLSPVTAFIT